jgi:hypothetical protein
VRRAFKPFFDDVRAHGDFIYDLFVQNGCFVAAEVTRLKFQEPELRRQPQTSQSLLTSAATIDYVG